MEKITGYLSDKVSMVSFLKNISLGGTISECFLSVKEGNCEVMGVDAKNLLFVMGEQRLCGEKINVDLGIANIKSVIKALEESQTGKFEIAKNKLRIFVKGGSVRFSILAKKEITSAAFVSEDIANNIRKGLDGAVKVPFTYADIKKVTYFTNLLENQMLTIKSYEGKVIVKSDETEKESFYCFVGTSKKEIPSLSFSCKLFSSILNCLRDDDGTSRDFAPINLYLARNIPIVIEKEDFFWCLAHLSPETSPTT